jgi:putative ABC transport system permease protein
VIRLGLVGPRSRRARTLLTAVGIAIGIAAMVAVLGVSESSKAGLLARLDQLGTNLLTVTPGQSLFGETSTLPLEARPMIARIRPVEATAATAPVDATVRRTDRIPTSRTGGIAVVAATTDLLEAVGGSLADGVFLNDATAQYPAVVLGAVAAERLGISAVEPSIRIYLGSDWYVLVGILEPVGLASELDTAALIGYPVAEAMFGIDGSAGTIYVRTSPNQVTAVRSILAATANPEHAEEVRVSRPSDVLAAKAAASDTFTSLFLGLAAVALAVAGIGIANVMLMSVLERRSEIGLRRSLGATQTHVALQFLTEALMLALAGGIIGMAAGAAVAAGYAELQHWTVVVPAAAAFGGLGAALAVGVIAGLYPAIRAARTSPTEALRSV